MDLFRESALEREGAQAAARGQHWRSNPFLHKDNMPQASGESLGDWSRRHDAWQRGFEGYFQQGPELARQRREKLSADLLKTMLERQVQRLPAMRNLMGRSMRRVPGLPLSARHARDPQGPDWDLEDYERSMVGTTQLDAELRAIVERLRSQHDMLPRAGVATDLAAAHPAPEEQQPGTEPGIRRIGWRYEYRGYRYDRLADAVAYAKSNRAGPSGEAALECSPLADEPPTMPSCDDRTLMVAWDIGFDAGIYTFRNYRYERLCDAVAYARLLASRGGA